jgi:hypothetical protein
MKFSPISCHFIPLWPKYTQRPVLRHPLCSILNARDQVSHPYKTIGKIIVLCILIFLFSLRPSINNEVDKQSSAVWPMFWQELVKVWLLLDTCQLSTIKHWSTQFWRERAAYLRYAHSPVGVQGTDLDTFTHTSLRGGIWIILTNSVATSQKTRCVSTNAVQR